MLAAIPPYGVPVNTIGVPSAPPISPDTLPNVITLLDIELAVVVSAAGVHAN